jgi:hypothetical protein
MKKPFVLIMVLALSTSAQAAISLSLSATTVDVDDTVTCSVISSDGSPWTWQFVLSEDTYGWTDPVAANYNGEPIPQWPHLCIVIEPPYPNPYPAIRQLEFLGGVTGVLFIIPIKGVQPGTIYLDLQDGSATSKVGGALTLVVVPEPMTITLLALGGLIIRRRGKK